MYSVMHRDSGVTRYFVCQIYTVEGSKYVKIRSPFQVDIFQTYAYAHIYRRPFPLKMTPH